MPRSSSALKASPHTSADQLPLALSDSQLDTVMHHAAVLHPSLRRAYVERVAHAFAQQPIGDGTVYCACRQVLKDSGMCSPPDLTGSRSVAKYDR